MLSTTASNLADETRLNTLETFNLLTQDDTGTFDRLTRLASKVLGAPVSLVSMVDKDYQFFIGCTGLDAPYSETRRTPLSHSFCKHVVQTQSPLIITDAREVDLVRHNLAIRDLNVIAYLGIPLVTSENVPLGSFCVIDNKPRVWLDDDVFMMQEIAQSVMTEIELRAELRRQKETERLLIETVREQEQLSILTEVSQAISHDLRTPLSSVRIRFDMLQNELNEESHSKNIDYIQKKLDEVREILDKFTAIWNQGSTTTYQHQLINLHKFIEDLSQEVEDEYADTEIQLDLQAVKSAMYGHLPSLKIIFEHLFTNAVQYNSSPLKQITVTTDCLHGQIYIQIIDNGNGIPESDIEHIFKPLYRVEKARSESQYHIGLGLTVVRQLVREHQGTINIESVVDEGTTVTMTFPVIAG